MLLENEEIFERIQKYLERSWASEGNYKVSLEKCPEGEDHYHVLINPSMREIVGGKEDGQVMFPTFELNIVKFSKVFDKTPCITYISNNIPGLELSGNILGEFVYITILNEPPNESVDEIYYQSGPKAGTVEIR